MAKMSKRLVILLWPAALLSSGVYSAGVEPCGVAIDALAEALARDGDGDVVSVLSEPAFIVGAAPWPPVLAWLTVVGTP